MNLKTLLGSRFKLILPQSLSSVLVISSVLICSQLIQLSEAHVSLTFPPSRRFQLDFLNSYWTKPPCGMPKGATRTSLVAGQEMNITWHLGYAHNGGYKLELLNSKEEKIMDLTPVIDGNEFVQGLPTAQAHEVTIPSNVTCRDCTIRLLRQVPEFSPNFFFWSCADVDIVSKRSHRETCSSAGSFVNGQCRCYRDYWGNRCQYKDECEVDTDCGDGLCIYLDGSALPTKQCFCSPGYFGEKCNRANPHSLPKSSSQLDLSKHIKVPLSERMIMFFKTKVGRTEDDDEIEFVIIANGTSYAGLGWRPSGMGPGCKNWPFDPNALHLDPNAPNTLPKVKRQAGDKTQTNAAVLSSQAEIIPAANIPIDEADVSPTPDNQGQFPPDYPDEPYFILHEWAAHDPFTPMDCSDIIIGTAKGAFSRVRDYYARGRHTPMIDSAWGGRDDLIGATGWEEDSTTTIVFRRKVRTLDGPDHNIKDEMLVIWARGQQPGEHVHSPHFQLDRGVSKTSDFYVVDELKYHGLGPQRGFLFINFTAARSEFIT